VGLLLASAGMLESHGAAILGSQTSVASPKPSPFKGSPRGGGGGGGGGGGASASWDAAAAGEPAGPLAKKLKM
jgi:hypothetical protein